VVPRHSLRWTLCRNHSFSAHPRLARAPATRRLRFNGVSIGLMPELSIGLMPELRQECNSFGAVYSKVDGQPRLPIIDFRNKRSAELQDDRGAGPSPIGMSPTLTGSPAPHRRSGWRGKIGRSIGAQRCGGVCPRCTRQCVIKQAATT